jgi:hypothetical protein
MFVDEIWATYTIFLFKCSWCVLFKTSALSVFLGRPVPLPLPVRFTVQCTVQELYNNWAAVTLNFVAKLTVRKIKNTYIALHGKKELSKKCLIYSKTYERVNSFWFTVTHDPLLHTPIRKPCGRGGLYIQQDIRCDDFVAHRIFKI